MKILFITSTRIGDAVLTTGLLESLLKQFPGASVTIACGPLPAPLFTRVPGLSEIIVLTKKTYSRHWMDLWRRCHHHSWDIIVDLRGSIISYFLKAKKRYVWKSVQEKTHRIEHLSQLLELPSPAAPKIWIGEEEILEADVLLPISEEPILAVAPIANWIGKQWPLYFYKQLLQKFCESYPGKIALFAAPEEVDHLIPLLKAIPKDRLVSIAGQVGLLTVAECLRRSRVFVGNDSGLMHLASAMGTPTIGLFGPTDERIYGPWGEKGHVIRTPESMEELQKMPNFSYDQRTVSYMSTLSVDSVYTKLSEVWEKNL